MTSQTIPEFDATMNKFRKLNNMNSELKWTKVSASKLEEYKKFVDFFFSLNNSDFVHFRSIIIDTHQVNHRKYNQGDKELGFYKFLYQLLLHCFGKDYCSKDNIDKIILFPDKRQQSKYSLDTLKDVLNNGIAKKYNIYNNPFVSIQPKNSKDVNALQINDLILGAISYHKNGHNLLSSASSAKKELASYIADKAGFRELGENSSYGVKRFSVWNFRLK